MTGDSLIAPRLAPIGRYFGGGGMTVRRRLHGPEGVGATARFIAANSTNQEAVLRRETDLKVSTLGGRRAEARLM